MSVLLRIDGRMIVLNFMSSVLGEISSDKWSRFDAY